MNYTNATYLGNARLEWLKALDFYDQELDIMEVRLAEVLLKNTGIEVRAEAEHFQNQFIVQRNNIEILRHNINEHTHHVFEDAKTHVGQIAEIRIKENTKNKDEVAGFEKVINDLRHEFNAYLAKHI